MAAKAGLDASRMHLRRAEKSLAGGVATAFRAGQRPFPLCMVRGEGARLWDADGNEYIDYALGFGPLLLGHSPSRVLRAVRDQMSTGIGFGACHPLEAELAEAVCRTVPSAEKCVFSTTGSEAVHAAVRIARAATSRLRIVKFLGHYNGWFDPVHVGTPGQEVPGPATGGQDPAAAASVTVCPWNDLHALEETLADDVAAVLLEPLNVNGGCFEADPGYLAAVREAASRNGSLLIFDEVITGYRVALGGAQQRYGVLPDLTVLGKALGAGFPISAVCGRADVMDVVTTGHVRHVGTFNANPVCAAAALAAVETYEDGGDEFYGGLERTASEFAGLLHDEAASEGLELSVRHAPGIVHAFAGAGEVTDYLSGVRSDHELYASFAEQLIYNGVQAIPRGLFYVSPEHDSAVLEVTAAAVRRSAAALQASTSSSRSVT